MPLVPGTRLGNYEIDAPLGSGGMGEVYRARDTRLGRAVAIKALPDGFARDPERLARFEREARALAAVHHSNIATIFGIEDAGGSSYLALELVEGQTLTERLARGALAVPEAIEVCAQIAAAVDAAHEQGIVHRDLKPGNVMVTPAGMVKVLDFGLAKTGSSSAGSSLDLGASPTVAVGATAAGAILGTASYMSPEQARGRDVDRRADVWALGCILYECLSGRQAFAGETSSDVLARVIEREPDWALLPASVPTRLRDVLRRCLTKNPAARPRDVGDLRGELLAIAADLSSPSRRPADPGAAPSVAVLYFQNQTHEPESDYFADGIAEDLLTDLSKLKGLRVASRSSVTRYRGTVPDTGKVAAELGVGAVLEGSVRRAGPHVRITVRLVSADGFQIWAERYDRTLENVFAVQEEIAASIAAALKVALTPAETERLGSDKPAEFRAYDLYLRGRKLYGRYTPEALHEAIEVFEKAIAIDSTYALAHAGIGDAYGQLMQWSNEPIEELARLGLAAARRAIQLNPRLPEAHKAEALIHSFAGSPEDVLSSLRRALDADPRFTPALGNVGSYMMRTAHLAGAERAFRRSLELAPDDPHTTTWLGLVTTMTGRLDEAQRLFERVRELSSDRFYVTLAHAGFSDVLVARDRTGELETALRAARADGADPAHCAMHEAYVAAHAGRADHARRLLAEFGDATSLNFTSLGFAAVAALRLGDKARATEFLRRRVAADVIGTLVRLNPLFRPLLDLEQFAPRRSSMELVWPLEAPMIDAARYRLFRQVRIESGRSEGSDIFHDA
jgi:serine/threonine protein kinase/tetratricopeptide (TPR) repeat protein